MKSKPAKPVVVIVTPAWVDANNGNWRTAARWGRLLSAKHTVLLADGWPQGRLQAILIVLQRYWLSLLIVWAGELQQQYSIGLKALNAAAKRGWERLMAMRTRSDWMYREL